MLNIHAQKYRCDPCKGFCANFKKNRLGSQGPQYAAQKLRPGHGKNS